MPCSLLVSLLLLRLLLLSPGAVPSLYMLKFSSCFSAHTLSRKPIYMPAPLLNAAALAPSWASPGASAAYLTSPLQVSTHLTLTLDLPPQPVPLCRLHLSKWNTHPPAQAKTWMSNLACSSPHHLHPGHQQVLPMLCPHFPKSSRTTITPSPGPLQ